MRRARRGGAGEAEGQRRGRGDRQQQEHRQEAPVEVHVDARREVARHPRGVAQNGGVFAERKHRPSWPGRGAGCRCRSLRRRYFQQEEEGRGARGWRRAASSGLTCRRPRRGRRAWPPRRTTRRISSFSVPSAFSSPMMASKVSRSSVVALAQAHADAAAERHGLAHEGQVGVFLDDRHEVVVVGEDRVGLAVADRRDRFRRAWRIRSASRPISAT